MVLGSAGSITATPRTGPSLVQPADERPLGHVGSGLSHAASGGSTGAFSPPMPLAIQAGSRAASANNAMTQNASPAHAQSRMRPAFVDPAQAAQAAGTQVDNPLLATGASHARSAGGARTVAFDVVTVAPAAEDKAALTPASAVPVTVWQWWPPPGELPTLKDSWRQGSQGLPRVRGETCSAAGCSHGCSRMQHASM